MKKNSPVYIGFSYELPIVGQSMKCKIFQGAGQLISKETPPIESFKQLGTDSCELNTADGTYILQLME